MVWGAHANWEDEVLNDQILRPQNGVRKRGSGPTCIFRSDKTKVRYPPTAAVQKSRSSRIDRTRQARGGRVAPRWR